MEKMNDNSKEKKKNAVRAIRRIIVDNFKDRGAAAQVVRKIINDSFEDKKTKIIAIRALLCVWAIAFSLLLAGVFWLFSKPPQRRPASELVKVLRAVPVELEDVQIKLCGYGTVESIREVTLSSQIKGRIIMKSVDLKAGQLIKKGQIIAKIDTMDYDIALQETSAEVTKLKAELIQLKQYIKDWEEELDKEKKILELCISDFRRQFKLQRKGASAKKAVETAQRQVVNQRKAVINTQSTINQKRLQVATLQASLKGAIAREKQARINIERSIISSPFDGRLKELYIDNGEFVSAGSKICDIADDTKLEIPVSLDAAEVAQAMGMIEHKVNAKTLHWFKTPKKREVKIVWTEGTGLCEWEGRIERIKKFCPETRTVTFIVRPEKFVKGSSGFFPLLPGMFCKVFFSGITLKNAVRVSWLAVQLDGDAYVVNQDGRLEERKIKVFPIKSEKAIICGGLKDGDLLVVQRLPRGLVNDMRARPVNPDTNVAYKLKKNDGKSSKTESSSKDKDRKQEQKNSDKGK
jgi:RND family efflux transporter MFP subunit